MKKIKVLMVYPLFPPSFWSFSESVKFLGKKAVMPPTGLATVAAMLPAEKFEVLPINDLNVEPLSDERLREADIVMFSAMIVQKDSLRENIARAKELGKTTVVGGPFASLYRGEVAAMGADYLVLGEAEITLAPFVEDWLAGKASPVYDECSVRGRNPVLLTKENKPVITNTPIPRWDLLKLRRYSSMAVQFSRGCPFDCEFCDIVAQNGHFPRAKTPGQLIAELEAIRLTGWRGPIFIVDDNFIGNRVAVRALLPELIKWQQENGYPFSLVTEASVDLANENLRDIREMMGRAGFEDVFCGAESPEPETLAMMNKRQNRGDLSEKIRILQNSGLAVMAGFIVGNDSDRPDVFDKLFEFIQKNGIVMAMAGLLTAIRGTKLYKRLEAEGRLRPEIIGNNTHQFRLNFAPKLDEKFIINGYVGLLEQLYSPKNYYARCRVQIRQMGKRKLVSRLNWPSVKAAVRIFYRNLIRHPSGEFARFIFDTFVSAPSELPEAIAQAVKFAHFEKITKDAISAHRYPEKVATLYESFEKRAAELRGDLNVCLTKLAKLEKQTINRASKMRMSLDPNFRSGAEESFERWRKHLRGSAEKYRLRWQAALAKQKFSQIRN